MMSRDLILSINDSQIVYNELVNFTSAILFNDCHKIIFSYSTDPILYYLSQIPDPVNNKIRGSFLTTRCENIRNDLILVTKGRSMCNKNVDNHSILINSEKNIFNPITGNIHYFEDDYIKRFNRMNQVERGYISIHLNNFVGGDFKSFCETDKATITKVIKNVFFTSLCDYLDFNHPRYSILKLISEARSLDEMAVQEFGYTRWVDALPSFCNEDKSTKEAITSTMVDLLHPLPDHTSPHIFLLRHLVALKLGYQVS